MFSTTTLLLTLAALAHTATASIHSQTFNFGASVNIKASVNVDIQGQCSGAGSFFTEFNNKAICCSSETRTPPSGGLTCPIGWSEHKTEKW